MKSLLRYLWAWRWMLTLVCWQSFARDCSSCEESDSRSNDRRRVRKRPSRKCFFHQFPLFHFFLRGEFLAFDFQIALNDLDEERITCVRALAWNIARHFWLEFDNENAPGNIWQLDVIAKSGAVLGHFEGGNLSDGHEEKLTRFLSRHLSKRWKIFWTWFNWL